MITVVQTTRRPPRRQGTYDRPENVTSLLCPPSGWEIVADVHGDCLVSNIGPRDDELYRFESLLDAWEPIIVTGELEARRMAALRWPKAAWQSAPDTEAMRHCFEAMAQNRAKETREAEAWARLEARVEEATAALRQFTERLVATKGHQP